MMPATVLRLLSAALPEATDADLLGRFVAHRDEAAFAELVRRHGPFVWRVCRRIIGSSSADDAFQATFLILACRAKSVRKAGSVSSWLVGVAGRVARQMLRSKRRQEAEIPRRYVPREASPDASIQTSELAAILDGELSGLPETLRDPLVLCLLHGKTQEEAASQLAWSLRTVRRRLARAKLVLRARLERRGVVPVVAAGLIAGIGTPALAVPNQLMHRTVRGVLEFHSGGASTPAVILAKGVVMGTAKLKVCGLVAAASALFVGLGIGLAGDPPANEANQPVAPRTSSPPPMPGQQRAPGIVPPPVIAINEQNLDLAVPATFKSPNFTVHAPSETQARLISSEAEYQRKVIGKKWHGGELPNWSKPCVIRFTHDSRTIGGATAFSFGFIQPLPGISEGEFPYMISADMQLTGLFLTVIEYQLPHEIARCVLATHFGKRLPMWADEGIAKLAEPAAQRGGTDDRIRGVLAEGSAFRLKHLFKMTESPRNPYVLSVQGYSVVRFLGSRTPKLPQIAGSSPMASLITFLQNGMDGEWDKAAKLVYGFDSVDDLEAAWIEWLKTPESKVNEMMPPKPSSPKDEKPELIPPTKLPGVKRLLPPPAWADPNPVGKPER
jgi:RNA polymerase sigma factor (sigma-70 family)